MKISRREWVAGMSLAPAAWGGIVRGGEEAAQPASAAFSGSADLDAAIDEACRKDELPGAVLLVGHRGEIVHRKAYGRRALVAQPEPMTLDTIFDIASLTKVVATAPSMLRLFEQGKVRLNDPVTRYLPEFQSGKSGITVRDLLTHFSGMPPDLVLAPAWSGYKTGIEKALVAQPVAPPGTAFIYSDINFILLGEIVYQLSGAMLPQFAEENFFRPLGMRETMFHPPAALRSRIAPTEKIKGEILRGVVHDETTRFMGGVAGHAGLFSTAADLARYAGMMLGDGELDGVRVLSQLAVEKATTPQSPPDQPILRGLGWDIDSPFSGNRGELFPLGSYGHTGFTGTSIWIDPASETYVILLANSVHPRRRPPITSLRARVATIVAAHLGIEIPGVTLTGYNETLVGAGLHRVVARNASVETGLDVLAAQRFAPFQGKRVGLITNQTGLDHTGRRNVDLMLAASVNVASLFSPEHGIEGAEDREDLPDTRDASTGISVRSLYAAKNRRPTPEMLRDVDLLVFDIQDIGTRFYTYTATMGLAMEAAAARGISFFVLDRPNPITGTHVEGPVLDSALRSFTGYFPLPLRHGMTIGELARLFNSGNKIGADLHVISMKGWERGDWFDSTGLAWTDPSPNMRSLNAALLYPGVGMLEGSKNYSVGRGTAAPFEQVGADWIRGPELAAWLNAQFIPGVRVYATRFRPVSSNFAGRTIEGVRFVVTGRDAFDSARLGLELAAAYEKLYPGNLVVEENLKLIGDRGTIDLVKAGATPESIQMQMEDALRAFLGVREAHLLYR
jgi:uncharacterized protein YbbC (DUF1343 family)